jgi:hypothetical protein
MILDRYKIVNGRLFCDNDNFEQPVNAFTGVICAGAIWPLAILNYAVYELYNTTKINND